VITDDKKGRRQRRRLGSRPLASSRELSITLAFFNLAAAALLYAAVEMISVCILLHPEAGAARYIPDALEAALGIAAAAAALATITQLIPGPAGWRQVRLKIGIWNLLAGWPLVLVLGLVVYLQLPGSLHTCP
jgi:hypothetical protein